MVLHCDLYKTETLIRNKTLEGFVFMFESFISFELASLTIIRTFKTSGQNIVQSNKPVVCTLASSVQFYGFSCVLPVNVEFNFRNLHLTVTH